jgi:hypothetical protein
MRTEEGRATGLSTGIQKPKVVFGIVLLSSMLAAGSAFGQAMVSPDVDASTSDAAAVLQSTAFDSLPDAPLPTISTSAPDGDNPGAAGDVPLQDKPHPQVTFMDVPKHFFFDEVHVFSGPAYVRTGDLKWLIPLTGATAASLSTDHYTMTQVVSRDPSFNNSANTASDWLRNTFIGVPVVFAGLGQVTHDDHMRESGILGGEAMIDAYVFDEVVKLSSWRERPTIDQGRGQFFVGRAGANSSFVSGHSIIAWSSAAVLAGEYPSKWHNVLIYTLATGVSLNRVLAQQHFPTDVLLGSASGWLIGHYVFRAHHHAPRKAAHEAPPA